MSSTIRTALDSVIKSSLLKIGVYTTKKKNLMSSIIRIALDSFIKSSGCASQDCQNRDPT